MGITSGPDLIEKGLVGCWDAGNPRSSPGVGTTWTDLSKNGNNGTLTNGPITAEGINKGVISFDGTDDYVSFNGEIYLPTTGDWTVICYVKADTTSDSTIWSQYWDSGDIEGRILLRVLTGEWSLFSGAASGNIFLGSRSMSIGEWAFIAVRRQGDTFGVTVDNNPEETQASTRDVLQKEFLVGKRDSASAGNTNYFDGTISNVYIYNRALTTAEIKQNYNAIKGRFSVAPSIVKENLVLHLDAGDSDSYSGTGTAWNDLTTNGHDFSLTNGATFSTDNGGSIVFDGTDDLAVLDIASDLFNVQNASLEIWVRFDYVPMQYTDGRVGLIDGLASPTSKRVINPLLQGSDHQSDSGTYMMVHVGQNAHPLWTHGNGEVWDVDRWYHIVITHDSSGNETLYRDGTSLATAGVGDGTISGQVIQNWHVQLAVGSDHGSTDYLDGSVAILRLYQQSLTAGEVLQNYEAQKGRFV